MSVCNRLCYYWIVGEEWMKRNLLALFLLFILAASLYLFFFHKEKQNNLNEDLMIKLSDDTIFYVPDMEYLTFNDVKKDAVYLLIVPEANAKDVRDAKNIIKIDDKSKIEAICNLITLETVKEFKKNEVRDLTEIHPAIFIRINSKHYFRVDLQKDYYRISQDNVIATKRFLSYDLDNKEKLFKLINSLKADNKE